MKTGAELYLEFLEAFLEDVVFAYDPDASAAEERARQDGHGELCYYCKKPCNNLAGNPSRWAIPLCHEEEPGIVKFHHIGCVKLSAVGTVEMIRAAIAEERARCAAKVRAFPLVEGARHSKAILQLVAEAIERGD